MTCGKYAIFAVALLLIPQSSPGPLAARVGDTGFIQLEASSAIDPIIYDQLSGSGLREKRLLEGIVAHHDGIDSAASARPSSIRSSSR